MEKIPFWSPLLFDAALKCFALWISWILCKSILEAQVMGLTNSLSVLKRTRNILILLLFVHIGTLLNRGSKMAAPYNFFKLLWFPLAFALQMSEEEFFNFFFFFKINAILMFHNGHWVIIYLFTNKFYHYLCWNSCDQELPGKFYLYCTLENWLIVLFLPCEILFFKKKKKSILGTLSAKHFFCSYF